jgi:hypothetical protein
VPVQLDEGDRPGWNHAERPRPRGQCGGGVSLLLGQRELLLGIRHLRRRVLQRLQPERVLGCHRVQQEQRDKTDHQDRSHEDRERQAGRGERLGGNEA